MPSTILQEHLTEHQLISAETAAALGEVSVSTWYAFVSSGQAPAPTIQRPRLSRWQLSGVVAFWKQLGSHVDESTGEPVTVVRARKHRAKRTEKEAARRAQEVQA
jgi:predicted DNA-binding transcriptional regulator AlpA